MKRLQTRLSGPIFIEPRVLGDGHYSLKRTSRLAFGNDRDYGALRLALRPGAATYAFITTRGRVLDSGTLRCRR